MNMSAAVPSAAATARPPSASGHGEPVRSAQPTAIALKTATCTMLSPQKSRMAPRRDSRNFSRASSPSQPSRIEWLRNSSAPVSCQAGAPDRKHGAAASPIATLTSVITLGVTRVRVSRRVIASEMRRSKFRDMKPSFCLMRLRSSQRSARAASAGEESASSPSGSGGSGASPNVARSRSSASPAPAPRTAASTLSGRSVSTTAAREASTWSVSA